MLYLEPSLIKKLLETDLTKKSTGVKIFQFIFPWVLWAILAGGSALIFYIIQNWESAKNLLYVWWFYMIPPMGKEVIIPRTLAQDHHPPALVVAFATSGVDMVLSLFLIWNYDWVKKIPILGPKLNEAEERGRERIKKTRWFSKVSFIATALFVSVPFSGAGGWFGTVFGRLMGVKPYKVLLAVFIGSSIEAVAYALAANVLVDLMEGSSVFIWISNVNIMQIFAGFAIISLVIYSVRHPREAVTRTSKVMRKSIDMSEKAVMKAEGLSRDTTRFSVMGARRTVDDIRKMEDDLLEGLPGVPFTDIKILDGLDREEIRSLKDLGLSTYKGSRSFARKSLDKGMDAIEETADSTMDKASRLTIVGLDLMKDGIDEGEYLILMAEDRVEKVLKVPKELIRKKK